MHSKTLYIQVLVAVALGILIGVVKPEWAIELKPLGDMFIALIKMLIGPVIFATIVVGVAGSGDMKKVGRVGVKAIIYFEVVSTFALAIGWLAAKVIEPGKGFNVDPASLDPSLVAEYTAKAHQTSTLDIIRNIIPNTLLNAFTSNGDLLQILLVSLLVGYGILHTGEQGKLVLKWVDAVSKILFRIVALIMRLAPIGAFGAMAFTIGKYGLSSLGPLAALMGTFYATCLLFIFLVLGLIARITGFSILKFIAYIKDELLTILGTSSSETVLVPLMEKLERLGCSKSVVGLVIPAGYSFNLDGTNIYLTLASLFIAQALGIELTIGQELTILGVAILTSKGASGVTGAGFITLAATLAVVPGIPVAGLALILGIDRFMSEARALTNAIGNGVATIVVSRWEGELDMELLHHELQGKI